MGGGQVILAECTWDRLQSMDSGISLITRTRGVIKSSRAAVYNAARNNSACMPSLSVLASCVELLCVFV